MKRKYDEVNECHRQTNKYYGDFLKKKTVEQKKFNLMALEEGDQMTETTSAMYTKSMAGMSTQKD
jgi:hypothetical protein